MDRRTVARPRPFFDRYERVYHVVLCQYGNLLAPGSSGETVTAQFGSVPAHPVQRRHVRRLRWYERLLNR